MIIDYSEFISNPEKYVNILSDIEDVFILRNGKLVAKLFEYSDMTSYELLKENANAYDYSPRSISYEEFIEQYEKTDDRLEYIDGKVYAIGSPSHSHQSAVGFLFYNMYSFFRGKKCQAYVAPYDVHFERSENKACVQPDIFVMCDEENVNDGKYYGVPALVIEIVSPSSRLKDSVAKLNLYQREGVGEYLLVDTANKVVHYWYFIDKKISNYKELTISNTFESNVFAGLRFEIKDIFNS